MSQVFDRTQAPTQVRTAVETTEQEHDVDPRGDGAAGHARRRRGRGVADRRDCPLDADRSEQYRRSVIAIRELGSRSFP